MADEIDNIKPGDTVWVSKRALSSGISLEEVRSIGMAGYVFVVSNPYSGLRLGRDCHLTHGGAVADAEARRVAKIASHRKQIAKLEALSFDEGAS